MTHLPGKVVAITGAGSGIGRALAVALAERGCALALCDIDPDGLAGTTTRCQDGPHVTADVVDVSEWVAARQWARKVLADHGHVDVVVNNAGLGCVATVADTSVEDFQQVLGVDLWGVIHGVKAFLPHLLERPEAHLVNVASVAALSPWPSNGAYTIAKYGVDHRPHLPAHHRPGGQQFRETCPHDP